MNFLSVHDPSRPFVPPETGLVTGLPGDLYHGTHGFASSHGLVKVLRSPAHFKATTDPDKESQKTPAMVFGSLVHAAILEPGRFLSHKITQPDFGDLRTAAARAAKKEWEKDLPRDAIVLNEDDSEKVAGMLKAVERHSIASGLLKTGVAEVSGFWTDPETKARCRIRPDFLRDEPMIVDYKTATDASFKAFQRAAYDYSYHIQAAFYLEGVQQITGKNCENFVFIVQEKTPPYAVAVYTADPAFLELGRLRVRQALRTFKNCLDRDEWPSYPETAVNLSLPNWAFYEEG